MGDICKVSVAVITYNQVDYIRACLDSILAQNTAFDFEIVIHDDASTDGTTEILCEYEGKYPDRIRTVCEIDNLYSQHISFILPFMNNETKGKYIAFCEGDDFWTDNDKLQLQYEALEKHLECDMCACRGCTITEDGEREISPIRPMRHDGILTVEDVILGGGQYLVSAGLFFRREMCGNMMGMSALDYSLQIRGALRGGMYYIDKNMAVYRRYSKGSWTNRVLHNEKLLISQWEREKKLLETFDRVTDGKYHEVIEKRMQAYIPFSVQLEENRQAIIDAINSCEHPCYMWGLGRRGKSMEAFLEKEKLSIDGVCDAVNSDIGLTDDHGNRIFTTDYVLQNAKTILVSARVAYDDLVIAGFENVLIDLQQYMPFG